MSGQASVIDTIEFKPHKKWYQRPEILIPVLIIVAVFVVLAATGRTQQFYRSPFQADPSKRFDAEYFWSLVPQMFRGLYITARATVLGFVFAVVFGFVLALGRRVTARLVRWPVSFFIEFVRSTPLLVQLVFLQALVRATPAIRLSAIEILVLGLGIHYATYCSEAYRAGINSVPKGQWEASIALNLGAWTKWTRIIIPQAVPNVLPALGNYLIAGFKDAPMGGPALGVTGILFFAATIRNVDFRPVEPFLLIGLGFLTVSVIAAWAVRKLEKRIEYERGE